MRNIDVNALCDDIKAIVSKAKSLNNKFLEGRGMTMEQARQLSEKEKENLQKEYSAWYTREIELC